MVNLEVAYATVEQQQIIALCVADDCNVEKAIALSGILTLFPEIDLSSQQIGIFSQPTTLSALVHEGDRIEIYRSLVMDPKEIRRGRAQKLQRPYKGGLRQLK